MKTRFLCLLIVLLSSQLLSGQAPVALHHNGSVTFYYNTTAFQDAYNASLQGDTIYLPGGIYSGLTINRKLTIYGAGFHPDSTQATYKTQISGSLTLGPDADSTHIEGLYITSHINMSASGNKVDELKIIRNLIDGYISFSGNRTTPCVQVLITGNVVRSYIDLSNALYATVTNNILQNSIQYGSQSSLRNNIFTAQAYAGYPYHTNYNFYECDYCQIQNNVYVNYTNPYGFVLCDNSVIEKNIMTHSSPNYWNCINLGNYIVPSNILVAWTSTSYNFTDNYHLQNPISYPGTDSTEVGIYGGLFPFKDGAVPSNPHISFKSVAPSTDSNGNLNINFRVIAQPE